MEDDSSFGRMEKAFSTKTMKRHAKYSFRYTWKEPPRTTSKGKSRKRANNSPCGLWASLDNDLLHSIMMKLNIVDYYAIGAVCRSWRSVATSSRDAYMKQQKPLVLVTSKESKRTCFLYNIFDGEEYKTLLPDDMQNKRILGLSCGYLITLDIKKNDFWLVNLMTRHELRYPALPEDEKHFFGANYRSILINSTRHSQVFMIVYFVLLKSLFVSQNGAESWKVYTITNATRGIADVKIFNKKIYVLSFDARICVLDFSTSPVMKLYNGFMSMGNARHLVIMDNQLCMRAISRIPGTHARFSKDTLYELDDKNMVWVEKKEMGKYSLFVDGVNATMVDTSNWGAGNCICTLDSNSCNYDWTLHLLGHAKWWKYDPVIWTGHHKLVVRFWYFPYKSYDIDCVDDSIGMSDVFC